MMTSIYSTRVQAPANTARLVAFDDALSSNPSGRDDADVAASVDVNPSLSGMLRPKKTIKVATFNVRTLSSDIKMHELIANAECHRIDVICIQEHRHYHSDVDIKYNDIGKWCLITSSATKNSVNAAVGGVGFLLSPRAKASLNYVSKVSSRIAIASFNSNPSLTIVSCYSPTNNADISDVEDFYGELVDTIKQVPKHNLLAIGGDFNAQLGKQDYKFSYHTSTNRNGAFLASVLTQFNLRATNTMFQKRPGKLWTIDYANGSKGQVDYILINRKWLNSIMNCEAYSSFDSMNSDHRIVTSQIRLSVRASKPKRRTNVYCWDALRNDEEIHSRFSVAVKNKYEALCSEVDLDSPCNTELYNNMVTACTAAAEETLPKRPVVKTRLPWEDGDILNCRAKVKELGAIKRRTKSSNDKANFSEAIKELDKLYLDKQATYVQGKIDEIDKAHHEHKSRFVWKTVNEITKRKKQDTGKLKGASPKERISAWKNHFSTLLGAQATTSSTPTTTIIHEELSINTEDFTIDELNECIKNLKNNKSAGPDNIPGEVWKAHIMDSELLGFCNRTLNGDKPSIWSSSSIIPIPKKGDLSDTTNYRGISLTSIASKIYNKLILNRLQPYVDPLLRPNQNGFRKGRGTISQILTIRRLIEGIKSKNLEAVLIFIDFKKAFDSIDRCKLMEILKAYGIPEKLVKAISIMYEDTIGKVISPDGETEFFRIMAGVLQGDTLAPFLFVIAIDYVLRLAIDGHEDIGFQLHKARSSRLPRKANKTAHAASSITDTDYADDLCLFTNTLLEAQTMLLRLEEVSAEVGLAINEDKTKWMRFNLHQQGALKSLSNKDIKPVEDFLYLGSWIDTTAQDLSVRIAKAWAASNKLDTIWKSGLSRELKVHVFRATVEHVLLYGAECWTLTKQLQKRLDGCYTRLIRASLNVSWRQRMTNRELYGNIPPVSHTL